MKMRNVAFAMIIAAGALSALAAPREAVAAAAPPVRADQRDSVVVPSDVMVLSRRDSAVTAGITYPVHATSCAARALPAIDTLRLTMARPVAAVDVRTRTVGVSTRAPLMLTAPFLIGMTALAAERDTTRKERSPMSYLVGAAKKIYRGAIVVIANTGYAQGGTSVVTHTATVGRALSTVDNSTGGAGAARVDVERGVFKWGNSASTDAIAITEVGKSCYVVDDQTVAKTDASGTRIVAGTVRGVDADGVWVEV